MVDNERNQRIKERADMIINEAQAIKDELTPPPEPEPEEMPEPEEEEIRTRPRGRLFGDPVANIRW